MKHLLLLERTITDEAIQNNCSNKSDKSTEITTTIIIWGD